MQSLKEHELATALRAAVEPKADTKLFALVDGTSRSDALYTFFRYAPEADYHPLFLGTDLEDCLPNSPYLAQISLDQQEFLSLGSQTKLGVIWFTSTASIEQQTDYWKSRLYAQLPDAELTLFRYWSGPILTRFLNLLTHQEQQQFLAPVADIATPDHDARLWQLRQIQPSHQVSAHCPASSWPLTEQQIAGFQDQFEKIRLHELEADLWTSIPDTLERFHPAVIQPHIEAGVQQAQQLKLHSDHAIHRFVECQFLWGIDFWQRPEFGAVWKDQNLETRFIDTAENLRRI